MLNHCTFIGNLGRDPEIRHSQDGRKIANLNLAVSEKWKDKSGERQERTEWVRLVCFQDGLSGVIEQYLRKGSKVYVAGKMVTRKWADQEGNDRYTTEIVLDKMVMLDSASGGQRQDSSGGAFGDGGGFDDNSDAIPF